MIACCPTKESGTDRAGKQKSPSPLSLMTGKMLVQLYGSSVLVVTLKSQLAWGWVVRDAMLKLPTVMLVTLPEKEMSKPPQGALPSSSSLKPREGG